MFIDKEFFKEKHLEIDMEINTKFTSEELKGIMKQPKDSCPYLNKVIEFVSISADSGNILERSTSELNKAVSVIEQISKWSSEWNHIYSEKEGIIEDPFVEAYLERCEYHSNQNKPFDLERSINSLKDHLGNYDDGIYEREHKPKGLNEKEHDDYLTYKKQVILENIEQIRDYAINERAIGQNYKEAYKNISIELELNDIIQPNEIIREEQGHKPNTLNLGILIHDKTTQSFFNQGLLDDFEVSSLSMMDNKQKETILLSKVKNHHPEIENIAFYKDMNDFQKGKGYTVINTAKQSLKNKNRRR